LSWASQNETTRDKKLDHAPSQKNICRKNTTLMIGLGAGLNLYAQSIIVMGVKSIFM